MGRSRVRTLLMASITIMLCMALLVGGTYALWSDKVEVSNHLQAGTLKVKLVRTDLEQWRVDERGIVSKVTISDDDKKADFTHDTVSKDASKYEKNVFGMDDNELIAPTSKYSATMRIEKTDKTNIAFDYNVYIRLSADRSEEHNV